MLIQDIDINTPYVIYCALTEEQRYEIEFLVHYSDLEDKDYFSEIGLEERSFGLVKELMAAFVDGETEEIAKLLFSLPEYSQEQLSKEPTWKVLKTIKYLTKRINELILVENEMLTPMVADTKYKNFIEQVDFSAFTSEYTQVRELAHNDITKFEEIRKLPYQTCLLELIYLQKQNDLDRLIMNSNNKK